MLEFSLAENFSAELNFSEPVWLEALPARNYHTPMYGEVPVTVEKLNKMVNGFKQGIRGQDIAVNFDHGMDRAKGNKAAGWYKDFEIGQSSVDGSPTLKALVQFTDEAANEIKAGAWKYFSMEWDDLWQANDGTKYEDVIIGGAITNRPVAKHMAALPVNFSESQWKELDEETQKYFAVWSTAEVNQLPDSAFLYIEPGGKKDSSGKTTPRDKRHFPYKGPDGKIDLPHLRNAIARIPQSGNWLSSAMKSTLQAKARAMLSSTTKMAEPSGPDADDASIKAAITAIQTAITKAESEDQPQLKKALALLQGLESDEVGTKLSEAIAEAFDSVIAESKEWEHSEPGTGPTPQIGSPEQGDPGTGQYVPRKQGDPATEDPAIGGGWRRDPMPPPDNKGDTALTEEELKELRKALGVAEDADAPTLISAASKTFSEAAETKKLREEITEASEEKRFAEEYPHVHKKMIEQDNALRESRATAFSESVNRLNNQEGDKLVPSNKGLSALAVEKVKEAHKKFSENAGTVADFEEVVKTIVNGGIVDFSEVGSSREGETPAIPDTSTATGAREARKMFAEKVAEERTANNELSYEQAIQAATIKHPELAKAYASAVVTA